MIQVVDASVVVDLLLDDGPSGRWCEERATEGTLAFPQLMPFEAANIVRRTAARGVIDHLTAYNAIARLAQLKGDVVPYDLVAERAWHLRDNLTFYDATYVATAERFDGRLLTLDRRIAGAPDVRCEVLVGPES